MKTTAIIGGGFSGTLAAVNLIRLAQTPQRVVVINSGRPFGRGTAYGTTRREHLLNVAARNMSAFPDHPSHFFDWLRSRCEFDAMTDNELNETFIPRQIYGDYVRSLATHFMGPADPRSQVQCNVIDDSAIDIEATNNGSETGSSQTGGIVHLSSGKALQADSILLATGNQPPAGLPGADRLANDRRYCGNPWQDWHQHLPDNDGHIVLLGTGLTAVDVIVTLREKGWNGRITAISRNGMLPQRHFRGIEWPSVIPENDQSLSLNELSKLVRADCERLRGVSQNPAIAVDKLRGRTQQLWKRLSVKEKQTFLKQYAPQWNVIRHRIAGPIHDAVTDSLDCGQLKIVPAMIESLTSGATTIDALLTTTDGESRIIGGDYVINCTGPKSRFSDSGLPLYHNLFQRGLAQVDEMDMGIAIDDDFVVLDGTGNRSSFLYAIGPILKGTLWETVAVPELRGQAMQVAQAMLELEPMPVAPRETVEYCI
ncbi:FAD/NAD(P)-binding protein [Planctomycetes bacterium K23_9]|uniref:Pyridine nucleotide-disulfide oxidoreductase n=1 Tax=Stieleria marina TaxID=1930275 RepID=A0A517NTU8_9BACT|nr:Pyridine nucleotide-disulfide oxidoreductase [Planctomycetes bacterium K23_9]